ncbi:hypothetical protein L0U88_01645 [Flavihumibacter sp. RY-1]|uniref:HTH HARE-type domain-containing protein n=1 Tax=Flavihumibacter fluminis TaxID=2909236 RepID=A0ABS9BE01_9BACT|nr:hypothetical protein [Flavihumibacter fluminis]MCF1713329.1 hypothetical protein [Flavihumibacter fluminis]
MSIKAIIKFLDDYLIRSGRQSIDPVEANALLEKSGLLRDSKDKPGKPLRDLLRKGQLPHAFQSGGKGSSWTIPHSTKRKTAPSNYPTVKMTTKTVVTTQPKQNTAATVDITQLKQNLEKARLKYKPDKVRYLLIAEAPPDSLDRFFYFENVHQHDYLFLGVAEALYPDLKYKFIASGRDSDIKLSILLKFQADGFYLLDLSELPLSLLNKDLGSQLPSLIEKIKQVANSDTKIILIKATVYDTAFNALRQHGLRNIIDSRIPFPGQGGQKLFQIEFKKALKAAQYL